MFSILEIDYCGYCNTFDFYSAEDHRLPAVMR